MNKVITMGRLTGDPKVSETTGGKKIARFTLALDRIGEGADFPNFIAWEKKAEVIEKYFSKGSRIMVIGRIQTGSYTNRDGKKVYTTDVIVEEIEFMDSKKKDEPEEKPEENDGFVMPEIDEELPFN